MQTKYNEEDMFPVSVYHRACNATIVGGNAA